MSGNNLDLWFQKERNHNILALLETVTLLLAMFIFLSPFLFLTLPTLHYAKSKEGFILFALGAFQHGRFFMAVGLVFAAAGLVLGRVRRRLERDLLAMSDDLRPTSSKVEGE